MEQINEEEIGRRKEFEIDGEMVWCALTETKCYICKKIGIGWRVVEEKDGEDIIYACETCQNKIREKCKEKGMIYEENFENQCVK